ncbi:putative peptidoglycan binding protein [Micromonospora sp. M71_S20]|uniref:peptidoglycan-binding domain-containing protein n=1 Tax=Micromonospora sp. M71_S20 TaxID=592872 RepID=UPI000EB4701E|nr:peptidoglycan-binding protein [Micromonospora sp. M71_S20]RLK13333.1 putative peptidoglycan binding protein [Micromonospora sp. M71_S20]
MTRAPQNLLAVRRLLLDHLNIDPDAVRGQDLEPAEVGIVGDPAHRGGYHCGSDRVVTRDYSVVESPRDSAGLTLDAAALDVGLFEVRAGGRTHNLRTFSTWCVAQCVAGTPDSRDIREIIYSPDGKVVRRWDRLRKRTSGDSSHLWHTHFSFFRDSIKANRDQTPLFRRYLTSIGLTVAGGGSGLTTLGDDMIGLKYGDSGEHVKALQYTLEAAGYDVGAVDGGYGAKTAAAVKAACGGPDGRYFGGIHYSRLLVKVAQAHGGQETPNPASGVTMPQVLGELARRLAP